MTHLFRVLMVLIGFLFTDAVVLAGETTKHAASDQSFDLADKYVYEKTSKPRIIVARNPNRASTYDVFLLIDNKLRSDGYSFVAFSLGRHDPLKITDPRVAPLLTDHTAILIDVR